MNPPDNAKRIATILFAQTPTTSANNWSNIMMLGAIGVVFFVTC